MKRRIIFTIILFVMFIAFFATTISTGKEYTASKNETISVDDLSIVEVFEVTSKVQNVLAQTYKTTVKAKVKNNTNKDMTNLVFTIGVETNTLKNQGALTLNINKIAANSYYVINLTCDSDNNYETVTSIKYTKNDNSTICYLTNAVPEEQTDIKGTFIACLVIMLILACACVGVVIYLVHLFKEPKQSAVATNTVSEVFTDYNIVKNSSEVELERLAVERENARAKQESARAEAEKSKLEYAKMMQDKEALVPCPYCGRKIPKNVSACPHCGATQDE